MRTCLEHLDENAELSALGMLAHQEQERVEVHVRTCNECAQRLGRAEAAVSAMVDATVTREPAPSQMVSRLQLQTLGTEKTAPRLRSLAFAWMSAVAAVFALVAGLLGVQNIALQAAVGTDGTIFAALVRSHFRHAQFMTLGGRPIAAKVVYDARGGWYEIITTNTDTETRVAVVRGARITIFAGRFTRRGNALILPLSGVRMVDELRLVDKQGRAYARVRPVLSPTTTAPSNRVPAH